VAGISGYRDAARGVPPRFERSAAWSCTTRRSRTRERSAADPASWSSPAPVRSHTQATRGLRDAGRWGYLFGDEGSAFWIGREAISKLMRAQDDGDETSAPQRAALLRSSSGGRFATCRMRFASGALGAIGSPHTRRRLASPYFDDVAQRGADRLADLAGSAMRALGSDDAAVCFVGGLCARSRATAGDCARRCAQGAAREARSPVRSGTGACCLSRVSRIGLAAPVSRGWVVKLDALLAGHRLGARRRVPRWTTRTRSPRWLALRRMAGRAAFAFKGVANLRAVRARVGVPVIGLIKCEYAGYAPYITTTLDEVRAVLESGQISSRSTRRRARRTAFASRRS